MKKMDLDYLIDTANLPTDLALDEDISTTKFSQFIEMKDGVIDENGHFLGRGIYKEDGQEYFLKIDFKEDNAEVYSNAENIKPFAAIYFLWLSAFNGTDEELIEILKINPESDLEISSDDFQSTIIINNVTK